MNKPNLIYIFADQMRAHATGYSGDPNVKTPHLDRIAAESMNFTNAVANVPVCGPSRACLLTGQYPLTNGFFLNDLSLPENEHSFGHTLKRAGYDTAWIGKWHIDGVGRSAPIPRERRQGFDYWRVLECTHRYNESFYYADDDTTKRQWEGYDVYAQTDDAAAYVSARGDGDQPFALFLSYGPPHDPYETAPEDMKALYNAADIALRDNVPPHRHAIAREELVGYYAHITAIDKAVGQLDKALTDAGLRDDTIFVFTSDHGDCVESQWHTEDGIPGAHKQSPWDESVCVPLLIRYPARFGDAPREVDLPICTADMMPTLLAMCGVDVPAAVQGVNCIGAMDGSGVPDREGVLIASYHPFSDWRTRRGGRPYRGIRTRTHTFVRDRNGPWMLFENATDPYQLTNVVNTSAVADVQRALDSALQRMLDEQGDSFESPEELRKRFGYKVDDYEATPYTL